MRSRRMSVFARSEENAVWQIGRQFGTHQSLEILAGIQNSIIYCCKNINFALFSFQAEDNNLDDHDHTCTTAIDKAIGREVGV